MTQPTPSCSRRTVHLGVELRRFATVEHAVVANDADLPVPHLFGLGRAPWTPLARGLRVSPEGRDQKLAGIVDALEDLDIHTAVDTVKAKMRRQLVGLCANPGAFFRRKLGDSCNFSVAGRRFVEPLLVDGQACRRIAV